MSRRELAIGLAGLVLGLVLGSLWPIASPPRAEGPGAAAPASTVELANARAWLPPSAAGAAAARSSVGASSDLSSSAELAAQSGKRSGSLEPAQQRPPAGAAGKAAPLVRVPVSRAPVPEETARSFPANKAGISRAVDSVIPAVKQCYEGWYGQDKQLTGKVVVNVTIEQDPKDPGAGIVTHAETVDTALHHAALEGCLQNALSELKFQRPEETILARLPFQFGGPDSVPPSQPGAAAGPR